jgi:subtilisin family serine protease
MMRRLALLALTALLAAALPAAAQDRVSRLLEGAFDRQPGRTQAVWIFFKDKGPAGAAAVAEARARLMPRALSRRALRGERGAAPVSFEDLPLARPYVEAVAGRVVRLRHVSRWFNAVSVEATAEQVRSLAELPFVERLDLVRRFRRGPVEPHAPAAASVAPETPGATTAYGLDYGASLGQLAQINVPAVHDLGLHGEGVVIAVFDAGFSNLPHESLTPLTILARHDFVNGDDDVADGTDRGEGSHGTETLSTLAGYMPGQLIGPAFAASFLLAKTEDTESETPVEEDNWAAAAEWAEGQGVDVISSSLGYLTYDSPNMSYTPAEMNGEVAISTRAADIAAARGVVVVNSAGNSGFNPEHNTLGAPADGKKVLSIGAVNSLGTRVDFSSVGPTADGRIKPDVAAQGSGVRVASPLFTKGYVLASGTSFSCPLTAGVVALVLQAHPTYTVDQVLAVVRSTASQSATPDNLLGYGIVNALAALTAPAPPLQ